MSKAQDLAIMQAAVQGIEIHRADNDLAQIYSSVHQPLTPRLSDANLRSLKNPTPD
jgi:hypothetical protein